MLIDLNGNEIDTILSALRLSGLEFTKNKQVYDKLNNVNPLAHSNLY